MIEIKKILVFVVLGLKFGECQKWIPIASPYLFQNYISHQLQEVQPPITPIWLKTHHDFNQVDFSKPKTQTFYKSYLQPGQSPVYEFRYKIHDPKEENYQEKSETRVGDSVKGYYSVREPNGYVRLVKYVSDQNGFKTQVSHYHSDDNGGGYSFRMKRRIT